MYRTLFALAIPAADAHMSMVKPASWHDPDGTAYAEWSPEFGWRAAGCTGKPPPPGEEDVVGCISQWYTNGTWIPGNRTLPENSPLITYAKTAKATDPLSKGTWAGMQKNPWMAPGTAPVWSPCGIDGGNPKGCPVGNPGGSGCAPGGYGHGPDARTLPGNTKPTKWIAGAEEEVIFGITANHGGGYQYRLCPMPKEGRMALTEECFQRKPMEFVGDTQWIQFGGDEKNRTAIPAVRTTEGTYPAGSQWTKNPIPACGTFDGGGIAQQICLGSQFKPPVPGARGFYGFTQGDKATGTNPRTRTLTQFTVVDKIKVPADIVPGDYVLSFRTDQEQTPQIWTQCSDVQITAKSDVIV